MSNSIKIYKLKDVCRIEKGKIGITKAVKGKYPLVVTAEERLSHNEWHFDEPATIVPLVSSTGHGHASIKRLHYEEGQYAIGNILAALIPKNHDLLNAKYLYVYLTINKEELLVSQMTGAANVSLTLTRLAEVEIEIPDLDLQMNIIKKYMDSERYRTVMSSHIYARTKIIEELHKQILQDGLTGKLTRRWRKEHSSDETAEELLSKIKEEKIRLVKEGVIKKQNKPKSVNKAEIPFDLPKGWIWCRLGEITTINPRNNLPDNLMVSFIPMKHIEDGFVDLHATEKRLWKEVKSGFTHFKENDLVVAKITPCFENRKSAILKNLTNTFGAGTTELHVIRSINDKMISIRYLLWMLKSEVFIYSGIKTFSGTAGQQRISADFISNFLIPLPPYEEQNNIVQHIESLFTKLKHIDELNNENVNDIDLFSKVIIKKILY